MMVQNDFRFREKFNLIYLRMQSTGVVQRAHKRYMRNTLKKNYEAREYYQVELEGVLFEHVKLIFLVYSLMFPLVMIVLAIEIIYNWTINSSNVEPIVESIIEQDPLASDHEYLQSDNIDHISCSTDFLIDELLEVIDLEYMD